VVRVTKNESLGGSPGREEILSGALEARVREHSRDFAQRIIPVAERLAIKNSLLEKIAPDEDVWVFGYGSLMWNPAFHYAERRIARLHGYHRRFVFWSTSGRGTPDSPGMMLALAPGGSCVGVAFRIRRDEEVPELNSVFMRELMTGAYHARWVRLRTEEGPVPAIGLIADPAHRNYAGRLPLETVARHIAGAEGWLGPCSDYLIRTTNHLREIGIHDSCLETLMGLVANEESR